MLRVRVLFIVEWSPFVIESQLIIAGVDRVVEAIMSINGSMKFEDP